MPWRGCGGPGGRYGVNVVEPETLGPPIDAEPAPNAVIHSPEPEAPGDPIDTDPEPETGAGTKVAVPATDTCPIDAEPEPEIGVGTKAPVLAMVGAEIPAAAMPSDP